MTYNFITADNGVGLSRDMVVFAEAMGLKKDKDWFFCDFRSRKIPEKRDVNIYFELLDQRYFNSADIHILIPNPEWFMTNWVKWLDKIDFVLCKTHHAVEVFRKYVRNKAKYIGFMSLDRYVNVGKDYKLPSLFMGKSMTKGAKPVYDISVKENLPLLLMSNKQERWIVSRKQVVVYKRRLEDEIFKKLQNTQGIHVCCSDYEGFGHYINEAKSTGAVIITTDYPPMNELCTPEFAFFVKANRNRSMGLVNTCVVDAEDYVKVIRDVLNTDPEVLIKMGEKARRSFLLNNKGFKMRIKAFKNKHLK